MSSKWVVKAQIRFKEESGQSNARDPLSYELGCLNGLCF